MFENLRHATDDNGHPIVQKQWDDAISILREFVAQYDSYPDETPLGKGLCNGPFLRAKEFLSKMECGDEMIVTCPKCKERFRIAANGSVDGVTYWR